MAPRSSNRSVYLPDTVWAQLADLALLKGTSVNAEILFLLRELLPVAAGGAKPQVREKKSRTAPPSSPPLSLGRPRAAPGSLLKKGRGA